jgi:hypothetical protein
MYLKLIFSIHKLSDERKYPGDALLMHACTRHVYKGCMVAGEPTVPFERVLVMKRIVLNEDFPEAQLHLYLRRDVQYVDVMDLIGVVNESASFDETQRVFRGLSKLFQGWEASGDFQWLMLHDLDHECGVTLPAGLRLMEIMWCAGPKRWRGN